MDTSLETILEGAQSTTSRQDLGLNNSILERFSGFEGVKIRDRYEGDEVKGRGVSFQDRDRDEVVEGISKKGKDLSGHFSRIESLANPQKPITVRYTPHPC